MKMPLPIFSCSEFDFNRVPTRDQFPKQTQVSATIVNQRVPYVNQHSSYEPPVNTHVAFFFYVNQHTTCNPPVNTHVAILFYDWRIDELSDNLGTIPRSEG